MVGAMVPDEIMLAQLWQAQWFQLPLVTTTGDLLHAVYRGIWTHRRGPDFADVLIDRAGTLVTGDLEIHVLASDWYAHGHHEDPCYDRVVLHVVWQDDLGVPVQRRDGVRIPTVVLANSLLGEIHEFRFTLKRPLGALGFDHCAPQIAQNAPEQLLQVFDEAGDLRLREKVDRIQARFDCEPPGETLFWLIADAHGYMQNREGMRAIAEALPLAFLESILLSKPTGKRFPILAALFLGVGGFLPASPSEVALTGCNAGEWRAIETEWQRRPSYAQPLPIRWRLAGIRPANHPIRRLVNLASLLSVTRQGLLAQVLEVFQDQQQVRPRLFRWLCAGPQPVGRGRAHEIIVNVLIPFTLAYAEWAQQDRVGETARLLWETLPSGPKNSLVAATLEQICGSQQIVPERARTQQGLLHLYWRGCRVRRCYECPVAQLVLQSPEAEALDVAEARHEKADH